MTREIKFRAWDKSWNLMFQNDIMLKSGQELVTFAKQNSNNPAIQNAFGGLLLPTDDPDMVFMQFTGLRDKNGVEIYEGDIVSVECGCDPGDYAVCTHPPISCQVIWIAEDARFDLRRIDNEKYSVCDFSEYMTDEFEVIGNIYEHPNLLKEAAHSDD